MLAKTIRLIHFDRECGREHAIELVGISSTAPLSREAVDSEATHQLSAEFNRCPETFRPYAVDGKLYPRLESTDAFPAEAWRAKNPHLESMAFEPLADQELERVIALGHTPGPHMLIVQKLAHEVRRHREHAREATDLP